MRTTPPKMYQLKSTALALPKYDDASSAYEMSPVQTASEDPSKKPPPHRTLRPQQHTANHTMKLGRVTESCLDLANGT
jgi:hypothetical protein